MKTMRYKPNVNSHQSKTTLKYFGRRILLPVLCFLVLLASAGCGSSQRQPTPAPVDNRQVLRIGACPVESVEKTHDQLAQFMDYLEKKTGYKVELTVTNDYRSVIDGMRKQEVDVAWLGPFSYIIAHKEAEAIAFAGSESAKGGRVYHSRLITHPETGIENVTQLRGHRIAFTDPDSTSGFLIPKAALIKNGLDPDKDLTTVFLGHHDAVVLAVKKRTVDAAAVSSIILRNMREKGLVGDKDYRVIYTSEPIPSGAVWAYREGITAEMQTKVKDAFFSATGEESLGLYGKEIGTFFPLKDSDFDIIRETSRLLGSRAN